MVIFHSYVSSFTRPGNCGVSADLCKTMSAGWIEDERFGFRQSPSFQEGSQGGAKTAWMGKTLGMWPIFHERLGYVGLKYWESFLRNVGMEPAKLWDVLLKTLNTRW